MSLSPHHQDQLHLIQAGLLRSDPQLAARLSVFGRLSAGQATGRAGAVTVLIGGQPRPPGPAGRPFPGRGRARSRLCAGGRARPPARRRRPGRGPP